MNKAFKFWKDLSVFFSLIWLNLLLFAILLMVGTVLLKVSGAYPDAGWAGLFLDAFHMAILERVADESAGWLPIVLSFVMPLGMALIIGEGVLRVFSVYIQKGQHREEWDLMVAKTLTNHVVVCGVGELGKAMVKRILADHPDTKMILVDQRAGMQAEMNFINDNVVCIQADMTSTGSLKKANCEKARLVLLTTGNDAFNLEAAYKIIKLNPQVEIWVRLHHSGLADLMDLASKPNVHFFSPYHQAAEALACHLLQDEKTD